MEYNGEKKWCQIFVNHVCMVELLVCFSGPKLFIDFWGRRHHYHHYIHTCMHEPRVKLVFTLLFTLATFAPFWSALFPCPISLSLSLSLLLYLTPASVRHQSLKINTMAPKQTIERVPKHDTELKVSIFTLSQTSALNWCHLLEVTCPVGLVRSWVRDDR